MQELLRRELQRSRRTGERLARGTALSGLSVVAFALLVPGAARAQSAPVVSRPVVQPLPSGNTAQLNSALTRLGRNPRDLDALLDAGDAARAMGDGDAATGFYRRADEVSPGNGRAKAGLAAAAVQQGDGPAAIPLFAAAQTAGVPATSTALDRGLAYDLVGDTANAQRYYQMLLGGPQDTEARLRLSISQAIAGEGDASYATLMPLLRQQDKPAWRTRAFALAIGGDTAKAVDTVNTILPANLASGVAPYLRYMPRLTPAQQAAAANLGQFPRASEIGHDDARTLAWVSAHPVSRPASADAGLIPRGEALGKGAKSRRASAAAKTASSTSQRAAPAQLATRTAPPEPTSTIQRDGELPAIASSPARMAAVPPTPTPTPAPAPAPRLATRAPAATPVFAPSRAPVATPAPAPSPAPASASRPSFNLAQLPSSRSSAAATAPAPVPAPAPATVAPPQPQAERVSLADAFADIGKPVASAAPARGAVDISKITAAKPPPPPPPAAAAPPPKPAPKKPAPPAHSSRIWVQLGIGRDEDAIAFDWRRWEKQAPAVLKNHDAYLSDMGRTNRVLTGPFESQKAANDFVAQLRKAGLDGMIWTSPAGQVVDRMKG